MTDSIEIRDYRETDKAFIMASMLRGMYYGDFFWGFIPKPVFMANYAPVIEALLASPNAVVKIACEKTEPDLIRGYSILSSDFQVIHWVFVKAAWRKKGIAKALLPQFPVAVTHMTKLGFSLMFKMPTAIFNPFVIR